MGNARKREIIGELCGSFGALRRRFSAPFATFGSAILGLLRLALLSRRHRGGHTVTLEEVLHAILRAPLTDLPKALQSVADAVFAKEKEHHNVNSAKAA